jgi:flagellar biogenesis protein FliO
MDGFFTSTAPPKKAEDETPKKQSSLVWLGYFVAIFFLSMFVISLIFGVMSAMQRKPPSLRQQQRRQ